MKKYSNNSVIWGVIIIIVGVIFLGNNLGIWNVDFFFKGWWTLFIIVPSLIGIFKKDGLLSSCLGLAIGILLLLASWDFIDWSMVGKIFIPILLILIGISFIFKPNISKIKKNRVTGLDEYFGIFSSTEEKVSEKFQGARCVTVFGGVELDLTNAKIDEDIVIDCICVFGGVNIKVPNNVVIKTSGVPIFGGVENKYNDVNTVKRRKTIYVNYVCVFGGIEIE